LSASLRDELLREIESLKTGDDAALWAQQRLSAKSTLNSADAAYVERGFQDRLMSFTSNAAAASSQKVEQPLRRSGQGKKRSRSATVDKTVLALPAPRRIRDRDHVKSVAKQPCLISGRRPADAHHLRFAQSPALGRKVSDEFTVPLCRGHHREVHRCGDESEWWKSIGIDPRNFGSPGTDCTRQWMRFQPKNAGRCAAITDWLVATRARARLQTEHDNRPQ
jgi:hypothetical protein